LHQVQRINNGSRIRAVIGGLHLQNAGGRRLERTVSALREFAPDSLIPCHCTGEEAMTAFQSALGKNRCRPGAAGMRCTFAHYSPHIEYG
jgi:7,8-dihydropterin-6-yl-methyl-4-(beta-D-ribofuranosyl)aminobenzene 5'-phosphate synthase